MKFQGYVRPDGKLGIRNKILIVALDECCDGLAKRIAEGQPDAVILTNHYTCMLGGNEETFYTDGRHAICANPNVAAVLVLAMGCGSILIDHFMDAAKGCGKPIESIHCIETGGTKKSIQVGREKLQKLLDYAASVPRREGSAADLFVGIKCGGSDTSSGIASNPSVGKAADLLHDLGATTVAGELIELLGCEEQIRRRAVTPQVAEDVLRALENELARWNVEGAPVESMSIGNCVGGLTTIEEKSFGALGVQAVLWTSGAAGFDTPLVPVIKVSRNKELINDDIDIDATGIMDGTDSAAQVGQRIAEKLEAVCNGTPTATEGYGSSFLTLYQKDVRVEQLLHLKHPHCPMGC